MSLWTLVLVLNLLAHPTTADKHQRVRKVRKFLNPRGFLTNRFQVTRECTQLSICRDKNLVLVPTVRKKRKGKFSNQTEMISDGTIQVSRDWN